MLDIGWGELVIIGVVALLVVGPKELPALLRTIGRYTGMLKKQANEFRAQFDEAMRETEIEKLRKDVESIKAEAESTLRAAEQSVQTEIAEAKSEIDSVTAEARAKLDEAERASEMPAAVTAEPTPALESPASQTHAALTVPGSEPDAADTHTTANGSAGPHSYNGSAVEHVDKKVDSAQATGRDS